MCGRYLTPDEAAFERYWQLGPPQGYRQSFNVAPTQLAPIIRTRRDGTRVAELLVWGFRPHWARRHWINARSETVFSSAAFKRAAASGRCLIPAAGWYEWQGERTPKQPFVHFAEDFTPIAFAGIWTPAGPPEGDSAAAGEPAAGSFAILTRPATAALAPVHDRMPVMLTPDVHARWLAPDADRAELEAALGTAAPAIETRRISTYVNKPEHDDPRCIEPAEPDAGETRPLELGEQ